MAYKSTHACLCSRGLRVLQARDWQVRHQSMLPRATWQAPEARALVPRRGVGLNVLGADTMQQCLYAC